MIFRQYYCLDVYTRDNRMSLYTERMIIEDAIFCMVYGNKRKWYHKHYVIVDVLKINPECEC